MRSSSYVGEEERDNPTRILTVGEVARESRLAGRSYAPDGGFTTRALFWRRLVESFGLVADAHEEHGLLGVLQQIDEAFLLIFEINGFAVGQQMQV